MDSSLAMAGPGVGPAQQVGLLAPGVACTGSALPSKQRSREASWQAPVTVPKEKGKKKPMQKRQGNRISSQRHHAPWLPRQSPHWKEAAAPGPQPSKDSGLPLTHHNTPGAGGGVGGSDHSRHKTKTNQTKKWIWDENHPQDLKQQIYFFSLEVEILQYYW